MHICLFESQYIHVWRESERERERRQLFDGVDGAVTHHLLAGWLTLRL